MRLDVFGRPWMTLDNIGGDVLIGKLDFRGNMRWFPGDSFDGGFDSFLCRQSLAAKDTGWTCTD